MNKSGFYSKNYRFNIGMFFSFYQRAFEDAAFGLQVNGLSGVVSTDSGVHLIMRTA